MKTLLHNNPSKIEFLHIWISWAQKAWIMKTNLELLFIAELKTWPTMCFTISISKYELNIFHWNILCVSPPEFWATCYHHKDQVLSDLILINVTILIDWLSWSLWWLININWFNVIILLFSISGSVLNWSLDSAAAAGTDSSPLSSASQCHRSRVAKLVWRTHHFVDSLEKTRVRLDFVPILNRILNLNF